MSLPITTVQNEGTHYKCDRLTVGRIDVVDGSGEIGVRLDAWNGAGEIRVRAADSEHSINLRADRDRSYIWINDQDYHAHLSPQGLEQSRYDQAKRREFRRVMAKDYTGPRPIGDEFTKLVREMTIPCFKVVGSQPGGGFIEIYNPLGQQVVSIQANKRNDGAVYVKDASGRLSAGVVVE